MALSRPISQATSLRIIRAPNTVAWVGNSLAAAMFLDTAQPRKVKGNAGWMNWAAGILRAQGKPLFNAGNFAISGTRTDEYFAQMASALASNASIMFIGDATNDIGQSYPTAGTVVATAVANTKALIKQANDAGMQVWYGMTRGANAWTTAQIGYMNDINRQLADYFMNGDDFRGPPNVVVLDSTPYAVTTSNASAIVLKNSADGTHDNIAGAKIIGAAFAAKLAPYLREYPGHRLTRLTQGVYGIGTRGLLTNPGLAGTGGSVSSGVTGSAPTGVNISGFGGATATASIEAVPTDADGNTWGNRIKLVITGGASAGGISVVMPFNQSLVQQGDLIKASWWADVASGPTGLLGVEMRTEWYPTTGQTAFPIDMSTTSIGTDPGGYTLVLEPEPLSITAYTGVPYCNSNVVIQVAAGGTPTVYLYKPLAERG